MPLIEELPVASTTRASHGWTYVPDNASTLPSATQLTSRKRNRDGTTATSSLARAHSSAHNLTAKQEKAIQQRLADLNKENYKDVTIHIPKREAPSAKGAGGGAASKQKKTAAATPNVKRILAYQRTFQHYLANEEAGVNVYGSAAGAAASAHAHAAKQGGQPTQQKGAGDSRRKSAVTAASTTPVAAQKAGAAKRTSSLRHSKSATILKTEETVTANSKADVDKADAPPHQPSSPTTAQKSPTTRQKHPPSPTSTQKAAPAPSPLPLPYDPALDKDPLLKTLDLPKMPSERVMQALLAEPPLSYIAARAKPLDDLSTASDADGPGLFTRRTGNSSLTAKPARWFCSVCGYWGKVRCKYGCGERVCGLLECWRGHEGVCSLAATAY
jgi:zinc finger HIT domain-containing protein 1